MTTTCVCKDPHCPACKGKCDKPAVIIVHPLTVLGVISEREPDAPMCAACAEEAISAGLVLDRMQLSESGQSLLINAVLVAMFTFIIYAAYLFLSPVVQCAVNAINQFPH